MKNDMLKNNLFSSKSICLSGEMTKRNEFTN